MPQYKAPVRDIRFVLHEVLDVSSHYAALRGNEDVNQELIDAILEEGARFAENELSPINRSGDEEGCQFENGAVTTPKGFKEAYQKYVENGWGALSAPAELGGQGLPVSLGTVISEMNGTANWSWSMYPGLSHGALRTIESHGTPEQKELYLTKLISGEWTGTMCLTEPHCGTDLGILRTKAEPNADGSYAITGTKIFISAGDHDMVDNIVHIVLARLPDAPKGTKCISLFIVPKYNVNADGSMSERNGVVCGSIEHKMGIRASATCVLNFEGAKGFLIGPPNRGLNCMFTFMNTARVGTALQGTAAAELAFQGSLAYAKDRIAMRSLSGAKAPEKEAAPIIVHPDVRRMLLTQKAFAEGGRALLYFLAMQTDIVENHAGDAEARQFADDLMAFLTPIAKAFCTETGFEAANHGLQVFGGHGYIKEWGMEQIVRDTRISTLYEGTTGVQALDLLGRKVMLTQGRMLKNFTKIVHKFCLDNADNQGIREFIEPLTQMNKEWGDVTTQIGMRAMVNQEEIGAASVDYLMYSGYVTFAYFWALMAKVAQEKLASGTTETGFYTAKIQTARFYFQRILPRTAGHVGSLKASVNSLLEMEVENFGFY